MKFLNASCVLALATVFSSCVYETGAVHTHRPSPPPPDRHRPGGGGESRYYREGWEKGRGDAGLGSRRDPARHWGGVPRSARDEFGRGYSAGYEAAAGRPGQGGNYERAGREAGAGDQRRGFSYQPSRHWGSVPARFRDEFSRGYAEGFRTRPGRR